jgi:hypothetical protein
LGVVVVPEPEGAAMVAAGIERVRHRESTSTILWPSGWRSVHSAGRLAGAGGGECVTVKGIVRPASYGRIAFALPAPKNHAPSARARPVEQIASENRSSTAGLGGRRTGSKARVARAREADCRVAGANAIRPYERSVPPSGGVPIPNMAGATCGKLEERACVQNGRYVRRGLSV